MGEYTRAEPAVQGKTHIASYGAVRQWREMVRDCWTGRLLLARLLSA